MKVRTRWISGITAVASLAVLVLFAVAARAQSETASFTYIVFPPGAFPPFSNIARAADGQTIQMAGSGPLSIHPKSVAGGGTFTHKDSAGAVVAKGTWIAVELLSFSDYGTAITVFPPNVHGGLAIMRVHLTPSTGGAGVDAVLWIDCAINQPGFNAHNCPEFFATPPSDGCVHKNPEGIRLAVDGGPNFNEKVDGVTVFLAI